MPIVVFKLFAGQGTRRTDRRTDTWTKQLLYASAFEEHNNTCVVVNFSTDWYLQNLLLLYEITLKEICTIAL